ncbi:MAG TPA: tail fiber domain-containing protein [Bacteroidia bacterium]|nr:tail fiber domain-containing protein [Bacteroidia bacterium]
MKKILLPGVLAILLMATTQKANAQWGLTGNAGTNPATNFLGTTDNKALKIKTNNVVRMTFTGAGKIGIGNSAPISRLDILGSSTALEPVVNIVGKYSGAVDVVGLSASSTPSDTNGIGVQGRGNYTGVDGYGNFIGVSGEGVLGTYGYSDVTGTSLDPTGATGVAAGGNVGNGVFGYSTNATQNIAIWGIASDTSTATSPVDFAGYFQGNMLAWRYYTPSDSRLKTNIQPLGNVLSKVAKLQTANYNFKTAEYPNLYLPTDLQTGFMAANIQEQFPNLVSDVHLPSKVDKNGKLISQEADIKVVNYMGMVPVLTAAIQEQQAQIATKDAAIADLQSKLNTLESRLNAIEAALSNANAEKSTATLVGATLDQNSPNPFSQSTTIQYSLPDSYSSASLVLTSSNGVVMRNYTLKGRARGSVVLNANELSAGNYSYSLIVDGVVISSKNLMLTK